jgi:hypothetical protein
MRCIDATPRPNPRVRRGVGSTRHSDGAGSITRRTWCAA